MNVDLRYVVIGGGPTAAAAALALCGRDESVTVLDIGWTIEPERAAARDRLATSTPDRWGADDLQAVRYTSTTGQSLAIKRLFGSDVAFRENASSAITRAPDVGAIASGAFGGLSTVWGAGVLTYTARDIATWPVGHDELEEHAREVIKVLPYSASEDELGSIYPILREPDGFLRPSAVASQLAERLAKRSGALHDLGVHAGGARLAVRAGSPAPSNGCIYCARCLDGCPYGHIYSADQTIGALRNDHQLDYRPGMRVDRLTEDGHAVVIEGEDLRCGESFRIRATRVFLAAGALATTAILQRSALLPRRVDIFDSQTFYVPMLWTGKSSARPDDKDYTLAQMFLIAEDDAVSKHPIHASIYTYNDSLVERARQLHPRLTDALGPLIDRLARRLVIAIGFLHSDESDHMTSNLQPNGTEVMLTASSSERPRQVIARFSRTLRRAMMPAGLIPLSLLIERAKPGGGYHYGGSIPMASNPRVGESDLLGRPFGSERVHVVDSSCFPTIPGSTITLPAMANAHRIAQHAVLLDNA
jgi:choline dehydrogenase-like flavoprotein